MSKTKINTLTTQAFRNQFMKEDKKLSQLLKPGYDKFFIAPVEDLLKQIKLPVPPQRASIHNIIYLTEGTANMTIGSESFKISKGELLIVPAGQLYCFSKKDKNKGYICSFHNDFIIPIVSKNNLHKVFEFLEVWGNHRVKLDKGINQFVTQLLHRMYTAYQQNGLEQTSFIQACFVTFLYEIRNSYKPLSSGNHVRYIALANKFKELIFTHFKTQHRVSYYTSQLHITPNHLNKVIKQITGKSPTKWIDETLVMEAKVLLYQTNFSITEVATEIGIEDPSYFSRLFKKYEEITPIQFQKMIETS